jgi:hypothetical protein
MGENYSYKILLKDRAILQHKRIYEIIPDLLVDKPIPATYGYFYLQDALIYCQKLLSHLKEYEKTLGITLCEKLRQLCEKQIRNWNDISAVVFSSEIEQEVGLKIRDVSSKLIVPYPECLESCIAHVFLFTKKLLNVRGGKMVDPTCNDGLYADLKSAKKFYETIKALREWETKKLWDSVWEPYGGTPTDEELEKIPDVKLPFVIEEIDWTWGWGTFEETQGYLIDIRDLRVNPKETLEELENRTDQAIKPIKKYLSRKRPSLSSWWG